MRIRLISATLLLCLAAACGEKPHQQLVQNEDQVAARDQRPLEDGRRQRTLGQNEANRIYNEGGLR
jgi:hypothetical protein